jgi:hypothetical protein
MLLPGQSEDLPLAPAAFEFTPGSLCGVSFPLVGRIKEGDRAAPAGQASSDNLPGQLLLGVRSGL